MAVGPEIPLVDGLGDKLEAAGIHWFWLLFLFILVLVPVRKLR